VTVPHAKPAVLLMTLLLSCNSTARSSSPFLIRDEFSRTVRGSWGGPGPGLAWQHLTTAGKALKLWVDGERGEAAAPAGINKEIEVVGPETAKDVEAAATFTVSWEPKTGIPNHWHILLRVAGTRTYYSFLLYPQPGRPAVEKILRARDGVFQDLSRTVAQFVARTGDPYRLKGRVVTREGGVWLFLRAWPATDPEPRRWDLSAVDRSAARILSGRAGVRLSFYMGPARIAVDDFTIQPV
jgi:hypothetical protein